MQSLSESYEAISAWFGTPLGRRLLISERKIIADEMRYLFGYHFMQLSSVKMANFCSSSRISHCFALAPAESGAPDRGYSVQGVADFTELPLDDDSIDVTVLHHVLEFSENPHQVLKEAARVTIPRGYIIIVAFNPLSIFGMLQPLCSLFRRRGISKRRALMASRMRDWLEFLDFTCMATRNVFHTLPINNARYLASTRLWENIHYKNKTRIPGGMSFVLVARKDKAGLIPLKPKWEKPAFLGAVPLPKQALRSKSNALARTRPPVKRI